MGRRGDTFFLAPTTSKRLLRRLDRAEKLWKLFCFSTDFFTSQVKMTQRHAHKEKFLRTAIGNFFRNFLMTTPAIFICKSPRISQLALESKVRTLIILLETTIFRKEKKVKVKPPSSKILDEALRRPKFTISGPSAI